jgi:DNA-binding MarR family transcriptional regulator
VIDRLERAGLARRARDPDDRRRVIVTPDDDGIARRMQPHCAGQAAHLQHVPAERSDDELRAIAAFLDDLLGGAAGGP